jgi:hypothetical protein
MKEHHYVIASELRERGNPESIKPDCFVASLPIPPIPFSESSLEDPGVESGMT